MGAWAKIGARLLGSNTEHAQREKLKDLPKVPKQVKGGKSKRKAKEN